MSNLLITQYTPAERMARNQEKRKILLNLLADEIYTSTELASLALGLKRTAAYQTLQGMEKIGLLVRDSVCIQGRTATLWGITLLGLVAAERELTNAAYEIGRVSPSSVNHTLSTQRVRIKAEASGWSGWQAGRTLYHRKLPKVPDAIGIAPNGELVAFEIELNPKTVKRYREIIANHLLAMKSGCWSRVVYLAPNNYFLRLERLFGSISYVNVPGLGRADLNETHLSRFKFYSIDEWNYTLK